MQNKERIVKSCQGGLCWGFGETIIYFTEEWEQSPLKGIFYMHDLIDKKCHKEVFGNIIHHNLKQSSKK